MAKKISKTAIGGFVFLSIILLIAGVIVFGSGKMFKDSTKFVMYFKNSVKGLTVGSPVIWHGVTIGSVSKIAIDVDTDRLQIHVPVIIEVDSSIVLKNSNKKLVEESLPEWINEGLRARLALDSLITGQMMIEIVLKPERPVHMMKLSSEYPEIPTIESEIDKFVDSFSKLPLEEIAANILIVTEKLGGLLGSPELPKILSNIAIASKGLDRVIKDADTLVVNTDRQVNDISEQIINAMADITAQVKRISNSVHEVEIDARDAIRGVSKETQNVIVHSDQKIQSVGLKMETALDKAYKTLSQLEETLAEVDNLVNKRSETRHKLDRSMDAITGAAHSLKSLMDYLERHPEAILQGKGKN